MGNTSLHGNRAVIRIGGRSQGCAYSRSKPDFQIPHRDLSRLGGTKSTGFFDYGHGVADLFFFGGKRFSFLPTAPRRCCCAHPWPRRPFAECLSLFLHLRYATENSQLDNNDHGSMDGGG